MPLSPSSPRDLNWDARSSTLDRFHNGPAAIASCPSVASAVPVGSTVPAASAVPAATTASLTSPTPPASPIGPHFAAAATSFRHIKPGYPLSIRIRFAIWRLRIPGIILLVVLLGCARTGTALHKDENTGGHSAQSGIERATQAGAVPTQADADGLDVVENKKDEPATNGLVPKGKVVTSVRVSNPEILAYVRSGSIISLDAAVSNNGGSNNSGSDNDVASNNSSDEPQGDSEQNNGDAPRDEPIVARAQVISVGPPQAPAEGEIGGAKSWTQEPTSTYAASASSTVLIAVSPHDAQMLARTGNWDGTFMAAIVS